MPVEPAPAASARAAGLGVPAGHTVPAGHPTAPTNTPSGIACATIRGPSSAPPCSPRSRWPCCSARSCTASIRTTSTTGPRTRACRSPTRSAPTTWAATRSPACWPAAGLSLAVGVAAMALSLTVGTVMGVLSGYFRRLDGPLMRFTDLFLALPVLPLLMVSTMLFREPLRAALGLEAGIFFLIVGVIGITSWMQTARIVRGQVLAIRAREYVVAARSIGARPWRIIARHVFPNALSPILVAATLDIAAAIITESALSFLGLGFPSDFPTWGRLLYDGIPFLTLTPDRVIWPGLAISLTVLSVNFLGDGLRDALDPHTTAASRGRTEPAK